MSLRKWYKTSKYVAVICVAMLALTMMFGCGRENVPDAEAIITEESDTEEAKPEESVVEEAKPEESVAEEIKPEENSVPATESETTQSDSANVQAPTPLSTEEQIRLLVDSKDVWYQEKSDKENSQIYYLVTDLDMNDRLEIIRCDYCSLPEFCKNRFFEVSADYSSVEKMDYDVETMWANGEENGTSHGIANAPVPVNCFWNKAGNRTTYYYIIPTREHEDGVETITQMSLGVNNTGKVFTDFTGYANMNTQTGEITYLDYNGFECSQEEFERSGFISYSVESGWRCDSVTWQTVVIDGTTDMYESLLASYGAYAHNPVNRAY